MICINPAIKHETHSWVFPSLVSLILTLLSCTNVAMQAKWLIWNQELDLFSLVGCEQEKENFYPISCATVEQQSFFRNRFQDIKTHDLNHCSAATTTGIKCFFSVVKLQYSVCRSNKLRHRRNLKQLQMEKGGGSCTVALNTKPLWNLCIPFSRQRLALFNPYLDKIRWTSSLDRCPVAKQ